MSGKLISIVILLCAAFAGGALYYLQVYHFYSDVTAKPGRDVLLVPLAGDIPEPIPYDAFDAINADSSPIRYRACFTTSEPLARLIRTYEVLDDASPRNAPGWFDCFDAAAIGQELDAGTAQAFLSAKNIAYGVDRIVAITQDGRGFAWHELNECGTKAYDGTVVGEECPPRPEPAS